MLSLISPAHNLISITNTSEALMIYGAAFGTGAGLSVVLCVLDAKAKRSE